MEFVQIIEFSTSKIDEVRQRAEQLRTEVGSQSGSAPRVSMCADRDKPNTYMVVAEFPSHEAAMENSNRPEVSAFAQEMAKLCDGPPTFRNLDVVNRM